MVFGRMSLSEHNFDGATVDDETSWFSVTTPRGDSAPTQRFTVEGNSAIEICWCDEQVAKAILWHG
jgi:hypothetical protein